MDITRALSPVPAKDISMDTWLWLQILNLAEAVSDNFCLTAVTYKTACTQKRVYLTQLIPNASSPETDPEDYQNRLKRFLVFFFFAASKGKHLSYPLAAAKQFH